MPRKFLRLAERTIMIKSTQDQILHIIRVYLLVALTCHAVFNDIVQRLQSRFSHLEIISVTDYFLDSLNNLVWAKLIAVFGGKTLLEGLQFLLKLGV